MEVTTAILYGGSLAHYDVSIEGRGIYRARLIEYKGSPENQPPELVILKKEGRHWVSNEGHKELSEDLGYAVQLKVPKEILMDNGRSRNGLDPTA